MLALPPAPVAHRRRTLFVGVGLMLAAGLALFGSMLGVYLRERDRFLDAGEAGARFPGEAVFPEIAINTMLVTVLFAVVTAQWAVYALKRGARTQTIVGLLLTAVLGLAVINSQVYVWSQMELGVADAAFNNLFYAVTGTFVAAVLVGLVGTLIALFRTLGGRGSPGDTEVVSVHALYWYFVLAVFAALWLIVYVNK